MEPNNSLPGWAGPLVGAGLGVLGAVWAVIKFENPGFWWGYLGIGVAVGAFAGFVVWLIDFLRKR